VDCVGTEVSADRVQELEWIFDELHGALGGLDSSHLADELGVVSKEELNIDGLWSGLGSQKGDKSLRQLDQVSGAVLHQDCVQLSDHFLSHLAREWSAASFVLLGVASVLPLAGSLVHLLLYLLLECLDVILSLSFFGGHIGHFTLESWLIFLDSLDLRLDSILGLFGVLPILGLLFGALVEGLLAVVALLLDHVEQLLLGLAAQDVSKLLV
jgi:hypothetical protein